MVRLGGLEGIVFEIGIDSTGFQKGLSFVEKGLDGLEKHAKTISSGIGSVVDPLISVLAKGLTVVTGAMTGVVAMALNIGGGFEAQMTRVAAISGATAQELDQLTNKARILGRDLPISATDAAQAFGVMAQRGWGVKDMLAAVGDIVNLSISQQYELASSADVVGATLTNFKLGVDQAGKIVDIFNNAANQSAMSMDKFGLSLKYVAPVAASLGESFESVVAMLEALADAGMTGEMMGTGLRMVYNKLAEAAGNGGAAFRRMGVEILDSSGKLRPVREIFEQLAKSGLTLAQSQQIFGTEAATAALSLVRAADRLGKYEEGLRKVGSTHEMVNRQLGTWKTTFDNLKSSLEEINIAVFDQIKTGAVAGAKGITELVNAFGEWIKQNEVVGKAIRAFTDGIGLSVPAVDSLKKSLDRLDVSDVEGRFKSLGDGVRAFGDALVKLGSMVDWRGIVDNLETIAKVLFVTWAVGKIAGLVASLIELGGAFWTLAKGIGGALGFLLSHPYVAAFLALADVVAIVSLKLLEMRDAWKQAADAEAEAARMEDISKDYIAAVKGDADALARLPDKYRNMIQDPKDLEKGISLHKSEIEQLRIKKGLALDVARINENDRKRGEEWKKDDANRMEQVLSTSLSGVEVTLNALTAKANEAVKKFGLSAAEAGKLLGKSLGKGIDDKADSTGKETDNAFLAEAVRKSAYEKVIELLKQSKLAAGDMGKAALEALEKMSKGADTARDSIQRLHDTIENLSNPMKMIMDAVKGGFLQGGALQKGIDWINLHMTPLMDAVKEKTMAQFKGMGMDPSVLKGLAEMQKSNILGSLGLSQGAGLSQRSSGFLPGGFVRGGASQGTSINAPITIQIDKVIATDERQARQSGENIGRGIVRPMQGLTY